MFYNQNAAPYSFYQPKSAASKENNILTVSGAGTISAAPDKALITLGTVTQNKDLQTAQSENANDINNVISALTNLGIPQENIQTSEYRVEPQYDYVEGKQIFRGYKVTHMLQITLNRVDQTGRVVDTAVKNGANQVQNIQFTVSHPESFYNQALSLAIRDSQQKAVTAANTMGVALQNIPSKLTETSTSTPPVAFQPQALYKVSAPTPIEPGQLQITASVRAEYSYFLS